MNSSTLKSSITFENNFKLNEKYYNAEALDTIKHLDTALIDSFHGKNNDYLTSDDKTKFMSLIKKTKKKDNHHIQTFEYNKKKYSRISAGRYYIKGCGYQNMKKSCRRLLANGQIIGFDLTNAQPEILLQCCVAYAGQKPPHLVNYIENRKQFLKNIMDHYSVPRSAAKELIIRVMYGGCPTNWAEDNEVLHVNTLKSIQDFYNESVVIKTEYAHNFAKFNEVLQWVAVYEKGKKGLSVYDCALAVYLQDEEADIISVMMIAANHLGFNPCSVIHDELLFDLNDNNKLINKKETLMTYFKEQVYEKLGFDVCIQDTIIEPNESDMKMLEKHKQFVKKEDNDVVVDKIGDTPIEATTRPDILHGDRLAERFKNKSLSSKKTGNYLYDEDTGLWYNDKRDFQRIIYKHDDIFTTVKWDKDAREWKYTFGKTLHQLYVDAMPKF